ncbi:MULTISPECIES: MFS transporter [unclassified Sphingobium]|uniref:MFS transporter n=1 Tax=unclassified Sphingobium TaxID=2611147 RepID=UPI002224ECB5|nr:MULTISPECIES: MFS transporter [unclassified Sphingobium]MCW2396571.1 PAT family beta-lactamase induction signal transducer AmpG [Sphingobium sp. B8D3B]MCW2420088.1 PAT family beta-lactamase induction signal transducer AmpG [Sphingobium sp. B8D3C]
MSESKRLRIGSMMTFYVAQGLPLGLFLTAVAAWLASNQMPPAAIASLVATAYLPWSFKFIGAALMDRYAYLPMGRRRAWLIGSQAVILIGLTVAAIAAPGPQDLGLITVLGVLIFSGGAIQDVAVDGLAVDILPDEEQGTASAFMFGGQALGMAIGGAMGGYLLQHYGAAIAFAAFLPFNAGFLLLALVLRERPGEKLLPWTKGRASAEALSAHGLPWLRILAITFRSMIKRDSLVLLAASVLGRAVGGAFTAFWPVFATTQANFSTSSYSGMVATVGLLVSISCMGVGSLLVGKIGPRRATVITYAGYAVMSLVFLLSPEVAMIGTVFVLLSIGREATDILTSISSNPLRMRLSDKRVGATQFTIYNSLSNLPVALGASLYAWIYGASGLAWLMAILIAMTVLSCVIFAMLRIGEVADTPASNEDDLIPVIN